MSGRCWSESCTHASCGTCEGDTESEGEVGGVGEVEKVGGVVSKLWNAVGRIREVQGG